jgi:hypothetical protein
MSRLSSCLTAKSVGTVSIVGTVGSLGTVVTIGTVTSVGIVGSVGKDDTDGSVGIVRTVGSVGIVVTVGTGILSVKSELCCVHYALLEQSGSRGPGISPRIQNFPGINTCILGVYDTTTTVSMNVPFVIFITIISMCIVENDRP